MTTTVEDPSIPFAWVVERRGWRYSHTTAVRLPSGDREQHHTYRRGDHAISFWRDDAERSRYYSGTWRFSGSWGGSGIEVVGLASSVLGYCKNAARYGKRSGKCGFADGCPCDECARCTTARTGQRA